MKWAFCVIFIVLSLGAYNTASAQEMSDSYERTFEQLPSPDVETDTMLLYIPLGDYGGLFEKLTRWNFNFVTHRLRGTKLRHQETLLWGLRQFRNFNPTTYYDGELSIDGSLRYSTKSYAFGADIDAIGNIGGVSYQFSGALRQGNDAFIEGIGTNSFAGSFTAYRKFGDIAIRATFMGSRSIVGQRGWTTQEVYTLAGDRFYNPSWGWLDGERVNARERRNTPRLASVDIFLPNDITLSASWLTGERTTTGLAWFEATNPYPDYYTKLPSYWADDMGIEEVWRRGDSRYTQLDWEEMFRINQTSGHTAYVADERVEAVNNFTITGKWTPPLDGYNSDIELGIRLRHNQSDYFRRVRSLLGDEPFYDIDQYLIDDEFFGDKVQNDLRSVGRKVGVGDKFGYNYIIRNNEANLYVKGKWWNEEQISGNYGGEIIFSSLEREGLYEKATFAGNDSYGRSKKVPLTTFTLGGDIVYAFNPNNYLTLALRLGAENREYDDIFLAPQSNNYTTRNPGVDNFVKSLISYNGYLFDWLQVEATGYADLVWGAEEIYRYYDDTYHLYSLATLSDISALRSGAELAAEIALTNRLTFRTAAALNYYRYTNNPKLNIVADVDLSPLLTNSESAVSGMAVSPSPQTMLFLGFRYYSPSGWLAEVSYSVAGGRYILPYPVRRTTHVASQASSPETRDAFLEQQRLPVASNLRLYVSRRWQRWTFAVSLDNILDSYNIYGAYEPMRIRRVGTSPNVSYAPFPIRELYSYPRTISLSVSYRI